MKSPFPGMDPYLEKSWGDVHTRLILYSSDQLRHRLPRDLRSRVQERVFVESADGVGRSMYPDVRVVKREPPRPATRPGSGGIATAEPLIIRLEDEEVTQPFIEIIDVGSGQRVITVIEFISLSNKVAGTGQEKYRQKQQELKEAGVSLVEIDLLRSGRRVFSLPEVHFPSEYRTPYRICVRRGWESTKAEIYRISLRDPLPAIKIPLRESDLDVPLELQPVLERSYDEGDYDDIDYNKDPDPPLEPEDAAWADALLRQKGKRK